MLETKIFDQKTERLDRLLAFASGFVALCVYLLTLSPGVYPGQSATLMATCAGLEPVVAPNHPLWMLLAARLAEWNVFSLPVRMNLFSAVCGALSVGFMYRLLSFFVRKVVTEGTINDKKVNVAAILAGLTGAVAMGFSIPCWSVATRLHYQSFDLLFFLGTLYLVAIYIKTNRIVIFALFALLYGVGIVESTIFIACAPAAGCVAVVSLWAQRHLSRKTVALLIFLILLGTGMYGVFAWHFFHSEDISLRGYHTVLDVVVQMWRDQYGELTRSLPRVNWIWLLFQSTLPAVAAAAAARRSLNNERSWSLYILHLILTVLAIGVLVDAPKSWLWQSPWQIVRINGVLPVATYSIMAMVIGYLSAYWYLLMSVREVRHDQALSNLTKRTGNWMGAVLAWPLIVLVAVAACINFFQANGRRGMGADVCARELLDHMGSRTWIVTDGTLDNHIRILARERGKTIRLLCLQKDMNRIYLKQLARTIMQDNVFPNNNQRMLNTLDLGVLPFIQDWLAGDPDIGRKMVIFGVPDLWYGAGLLPIPDQTDFIGSRSTDKANGSAMAADYLAFWNRMEKVLPRDMDSTDPTALFCNGLRRHIGFVGNNLGVMLEDMGHTNEAATIYARVRQIDPDNISTLFNQFEMARRGTDDVLKASIEKELRTFIEHQHFQYPLWSLSRYFGYVRSPELFVRLGWVWAMSGEKEAALAGIKNAAALLPQTTANQIDMQRITAAVYMLRQERDKSEDIYRQMLVKDPNDREAIRSMANLAIFEGSFDKAKTWLDRLQATGIPKNQINLELAIFHLATGNLAQARILVQSTLDLQPENLQAWGMLAIIELQQANAARTTHQDGTSLMEEVEQTILPKMETISGTPDQYFIQIVRAQLAMQKGVKFYRTAREAYIRASILRPDVFKLNDAILQLDIALADQVRGEEHARQVLRINRKHALANYVMGSLRLQSGEYGEAVDYLTRSVETEPLPIALNDLAEVLHRIRKLNDAEVRAREAAQLAPNFYIVWETLASILMEDPNRLKEAEEVLSKAITLNNSDDIRLQLSLAQLKCMKGDFDGARDTLNLVRNRQGELSAYDMNRFTQVSSIISKQR